MEFFSDQLIMWIWSWGARFVLGDKNVGVISLQNFEGGSVDQRKVDYENGEGKWEIGEDQRRR